MNQQNFDLIKIENINELKYKLTREFDIDFLENSAAAISIRSENDAKSVLSMALQTRKLEKALDESRLQIIKPHFDYQKAINKLVKDFKDKLNSIEENLKLKLDNWSSEQKENPFSDFTDLKVEDGTYHIKEEWSFEILNFDSIPKEYLKIDEKLIEKDISLGVRNIPGIEIKKITKTSLRIKN